MDKSRFDRLHVKLFAAIAGTVAGLAIAAYLVFSWSFNRGFLEYVNRADEARLEPMIARLAEGYGREGSWDWIAGDRARWFELSRDALGLSRPASEAADGSAARPGRGAGYPLTIDPRLLLFDAGRQQIIGRPGAAKSAVLKTIVWQGRTAGYLGYVPRPEVLESIEHLYLQRQHLTFASIAVGMLLASLVLGAGLAYWLTRRIRVLASAAGALIQGDYRVSVAAHGHDELAQLARDFNTLAVTLAAAREARQQWIADIAHELRTPLAVLHAEIESLQDGVRPLDQAAVASLATEASRLARLVEDLHTLSLSDLGVLTYYKEPADLAEILADFLEGQQRVLDERGLVPELRLQAGTKVLVDDARMAQVLGNLLQNTLRYTDAPGKLAVTLRRNGDRVIVDWEDSSPGVPHADLPRLTERLFRVEGSRSRMGGGAGLGLAIARAIVEGHGGALSAHASGLGGLAIRLDFPAVTGVTGAAHG